MKWNLLQDMNTILVMGQANRKSLEKAIPNQMSKVTYNCDLLQLTTLGALGIPYLPSLLWPLFTIQVLFSVKQREKNGGKRIPTNQGKRRKK